MGKLRKLGTTFATVAAFGMVIATPALAAGNCTPAKAGHYKTTAHAAVTKRVPTTTPGKSAVTVEQSRWSKLVPSSTVKTTQYQFSQVVTTDAGPVVQQARLFKTVNGVNEYYFGDGSYPGSTTTKVGEASWIPTSFFTELTNKGGWSAYGDAEMRPWPTGTSTTVYKTATGSTTDVTQAGWFVQKAFAGWTLSNQQTVDGPGSPAYTEYYVPNGAPSKTLTSANWTTNTPAGWTRVDTRTHVVTPATQPVTTWKTVVVKKAYSTNVWVPATAGNCAVVKPKVNKPGKHGTSVKAGSHHGPSAQAKAKAAAQAKANARAKAAAHAQAKAKAAAQVRANAKAKADARARAAAQAAAHAKANAKARYPLAKLGLNENATDSSSNVWRYAVGGGILVGMGLWVFYPRRNEDEEEKIQD